MPFNITVAADLHFLTGLSEVNRSWNSCRSILVIRTDHMGDLIMSTPAIACLKGYTGASVTLLTSPQAAPCTALIPEIDDYLIADLPWMNPATSWGKTELGQLIRQIEERNFDACIIFTVYSQSALPAALIAWEAGIPRRLAYARENPYQLLTHWLPDSEPYSQILHQVQRDLRLVSAIIDDKKSQGYDLHKKISLKVSPAAQKAAGTKITRLLAGATSVKHAADYLVFHTGASEIRRNYPADRWIELGKAVSARFRLPILLTGTQKDFKNTQMIAKQIGTGARNLAGHLSLEEFAAVILKARLLISVNTGAIHIASGFHTPVITLYARTNPQHRPWQTKGRVFEYDIADKIKSRNEIVRYVDNKLYSDKKPLPSTKDILQAVSALLSPGINPATHQPPETVVSQSDAYRF